MTRTRYMARTASYMVAIALAFFAFGRSCSSTQAEEPEIVLEMVDVPEEDEAGWDCRLHGNQEC